MAGKIIEIQADDYENTVLQGDKVVVDFYSTECPPCEALAAKYEDLSLLYGDDIAFVKIFRQGNRDLSLKLGVTGSPTLLFYSQGEETGKRLSGGIKRSAIMEQLDPLLTPERVSVIKSRIKPLATETNTLIFGAGPAGLTAGIYLGQAHIDTIIVDPALLGGYVATTHMVSNYPGFPEPQPGMMLSHYMGEQTKKAGARLREAVELTHIDLERKTVLVDGYETIRAKNIIIAAGSRPRPLNIPGEKEYGGNGISYCATCDGKYFEGKDIIVIGGGNSAIEESLFLSNFADKITIVHQFDNLQANREAQDKVFADPKIDFIFSHEPREFKKYAPMDMGAVVEDLKTGKMREIRTTGIFVFAGFIPNLEGFPAGMEKDSWGYVTTDDTMKTSIDGVYAVGDIRSKSYRQITTAVSDGTVAAIVVSTLAH